MRRKPKCSNLCIDPETNRVASAAWLEIDQEVKKREDYFWGWYCPVCTRILSKRGG